MSKVTPSFPANPLKFCIRNWPQSLNIEQNLDGGISNFQIYGQSLINEIFNFRTISDIDMKLRPVTELDKRNRSV